jgi:hypothetical protein
MSQIEDQIRQLSKEYEALTGKQGLLYISRPSPSEPTRYVFGGDLGVRLGPSRALGAIAAAVSKARDE